MKQIQIEPVANDSTAYLLEEKKRVLGELLRRKEYELAMARYRRNPDLWLKERFGEDPKSIIWSNWPGYEGHTWDGDVDPLFTVWKALANRQWGAVLSATSTGKTHTIARIVFWFLDCFPNSLVVTSAPKEGQLKLQLWPEISRAFHRFKAIRPYALLTKSMMLYVDTRRIIGREDSADSHMAVGFVAGVAADETSTTKAQGFHRENMLIITDETPGMPNPTMTAFQNTSTGGNNLILAVGNPDHATDTLSLFADGSKVVRVRASAYDFPNIVLKREIIPGAVTIQSVEARKKDFGEKSDLYKSRVRGIAPRQSASSLIQYDWLLSCWLQNPKAYEYPPIEIDNSYNAVGVDVANSLNGDAACLAFGEANILRELQEFQCPSASHLAYNLLMEDDELEANEYTNYHTNKLKNYDIEDECTGIDAVGVGVSTVSTFHDNRYKVIALQGGQLDAAIPIDEKDGKPLYQFGGLRSQMYFQLREDLQYRRIALDIPDVRIFNALVKELVLVQYGTNGGKIQVEPKKNIQQRLGGKSPNAADAVVYWNWMRYGYYKTMQLPLPISTKKRKK